MGTTRTTEKRTDDETVPAQAAATEDSTSKEAVDAAATTEDADAADGRAVAAEHDEDGNDSDLDAESADDDAEDDDEDAAPVGTATGIAAGAGAVVAAGLGLASVTGTWLGTLMAERQALLGQIKLQSRQATDQISAVYGTPWHTTALVNGVFALLAVIVAAVVLSRPRATWVRAVAWGGLALGVLGILISAGMYFDLFASMPSIPKGPGAGS
ncbi:hypothetical protein [Streptomyces inhibens]|uniref:hypothetical protein n=1 Tax=Streptomyces inhibens TaxID=2293571 RepID=UPI001EE76502|nr:hypothetical protein [Streptomyces inhibens]UKY52844.1 hypothetical protein KI385_31270 [Streptomyces inhibens]